MSASEAAVVNNLVFEAGVKSLSAFCENRTLPLLSDTISIPQKPRAISGSARTAEIRASRFFFFAASRGDASSKHKVVATRRRERNRCIGMFN